MKPKGSMVIKYIEVYTLSGAGKSFDISLDESSGTKAYEIYYNYTKIRNLIIALMQCSPRTKSNKKDMTLWLRIIKKGMLDMEKSIESIFKDSE